MTACSQPPRSPFATPLSGSAKEAEGRIRNLFQYQKKRPPILSLVLACALALSCGSLVSCQNQTEDVQVPFPDFANLPGEPLPVTQNLPDSYETALGDPPLDGLTVEDLPAVPVNLEDFSQSESWNETIWLLSQDTERDVALYGVIRFEDYEPLSVSAEGLYGVIVRSGAQWAFYPLDWSATLWNLWPPELWFGDYDGDGQEELAFSLAWGRGSQLWQESLYIFELDTLEYSTSDFSSPLDLSAFYDPEHMVLYVAVKDQLLLVDEASMEGAPFLEGALQASTGLEFTQEEGQLQARLWFVPSAAPLSNPVIVECPISFQDGAYALGAPELSPIALLPTYDPDSDSVSLFWVDERGQVMQARSREEYETGGTLYGDEDGYVFYRF